ncbi:MAG: Ser/Thr protein phosphatase family protein, UDP-2,3-diacylglucosamine hydrolase (EC homolog [uncultured Paraburkholderia sp.]|nr:MAG: Ser/Thr protein phosphatase family protein, UDP-2,3-diacylglucosamine hydrolase (EC homolog [uncultured Paraburkholderia sp.]
MIYVPGNHDEAARQFCDLAFGDIHVRGEAFHMTLAGKRLWIVHGDLFDGVIQHAKWLAYLGDTLYTMILILNHWFNRIRSRLGFPYWSLSQYLRHQVKNAVNFISSFERVMTDEARRRGYDGVVCGHIHKAEIRDIDGVLYYNDGDWVESLSALVETYEGELKVIYWTRDALPGSGRAEGPDRVANVATSIGPKLMKIMIVTDAWEPQVNGVVRTLKNTTRELTGLGHQVDLLTPLEFRTIPCPTYPEIRLSLMPRHKLNARIDAFAPDALHIATEGPLGMAARAYAIRHKLPFTTAYHTRFPEYVQARFGIPLAATYKFLHWFHKPSLAVMAPTPVIKSDLEEFGFTNVVLWTRGVDLDIFQQMDSKVLNTARPIFLYVGRVAVEKNVEAFLKLDLPGSKWVAGEGPALAELKSRYPQANYLRVLSQPELAKVYAAADVFVFPSRTDTFGLVLLEALACGTPVAAYPVTGPINVLGDSGAGAMNEDLREACLEVLKIDRNHARAWAERFSWAAASAQFAAHLKPLPRSSYREESAAA